MRSIVACLLLSACGDCVWSETDVRDDVVVTLARNGAPLAVQLTDGFIEVPTMGGEHGIRLPFITVAFDVDAPTFTTVSFREMSLGHQTGAEQDLPLDDYPIAVKDTAVRTVQITGTRTVGPFVATCHDRGPHDVDGTACAADIDATIEAHFVDGADAYDLAVTASHHNAVACE